MPDPAEVPADVRQLLAKLAEAVPMRRGSVTERYMKCSKPGCRCGEDPSARHGPYYSLTRSVKGRTRSRYLNAQEAAIAGRQIEAGRKFRDEVAAYWEAAERWADAELEASATAPEEGKKRGSKRRSTRKSSPRSKRS